MPPKPLSNLAQIIPYKGGDPAVGAGRTYKLSANENPLGCSAAAKAAFQATANTLSLYPDGQAKLLRGQIAQSYALPTEQILCTAGSDEAFQLLARAYLAPGDEIIQSEHGFLVYRLVAQQSGAETISVRERQMVADVDAMLAAVTERTRIVFLANPNNPTGTYLPASEVYRLHKGLPDRVMLVLDLAYAEYVEAKDYSACMELVAQAENVVVTRTFSKIHGLAALRLGWVYAPEAIIDTLQRVRGPFNVSAPAQAAGAAALKDQAFVAQSIEHNRVELVRVTAALERLNISYCPSVGNFVLMHFGQKNGPTSAEVDAFLRAHGLVLRPVAAYGLKDWLRLSIGTVEANEAVIAALADLIGQRQAETVAANSPETARA
jgi:histidinol-phosphate aminotransferase